MYGTVRLARLLGRAAEVGAVTVATLLATGTIGAAGAAQAATLPTSAAASAHSTPGGVSESFGLPAGVDSVKVGVGSTHVTVTRRSSVSPYDYIGCSLSITNPVYSGGSVQSTGTIRCEYPTDLYLEVGISYNGGTPVAKGQSFTSVWVGSLTVTTSATPGYYQAYAISILGNGQQYGTYYSSNVYIPQ